MSLFLRTLVLRNAILETRNSAGIFVKRNILYHKRQMHNDTNPNTSLISTTEFLTQNSGRTKISTRNLYTSQILRKNRNYSDNKIKGRKLSADEYDSDSDSDSDVASQKKDRGASPFWRRKMRTLHSIMDANKDGIWSFEDCKLLTERFTALGHLTAEESREFGEIMTSTWETQWGEISPYNLVTVEKYLDEMHHMLNDKDLRRKISDFLPFLFKAVDKDKSGFISVEEFKLFFACLGLSQDAAAISFAVIDKNQDGKVSMKEFVKLGREFFLTEDENRISKMFWGPLLSEY